MTSGRLLRIYLRDHHAGSAAGVRLAERLVRNNRGTEFDAPLRRILDGIRADREELARVMSEHGVRPNPLKNAMLVAGERLARLKGNGRAGSYSPLSRVVELEALTMGVTGKLGIWRSLASASASSAVDLDRLIALARSQLEDLERLHHRAAGIAFVEAGRDPAIA